MSGGNLLFVGGLTDRVQEQDINAFFTQYGAIKNITPLRNKTCYFITFENEEHAKEARWQANGVLLHGCYIRCMIKNPKEVPSEANIVITGLNPDVTAKQLDEEFAKFGEVVSSKISYDDKNVSKGYGFVQFLSIQEAEAAINATNGKELWGKVVTVKVFLSKELRKNASEGQFSNVYVKGFPPSYNEAALRDRFAEFGQIESLVHLVYKNQEGHSLPYGFVCFSSNDAAQRAVDALHGTQEDDYTWYVAKAMSKTERKEFLKQQFEHRQQEWKSKNLIIKNIPKNLELHQIEEIFSFYGPISSVKLVTLPNYVVENGQLINKQMFQGVAFVCFQDEQTAQRCLQNIQQMTIQGEKLIVKRWLPKSELDNLNKRKNLIQQQNMQLMMQQQQMQMQMLGRGRFPMGMRGGPGGRGGPPGQFRQRRAPMQPNPMMPPQMGGPMGVPMAGIQPTRGPPRSRGPAPQAVPQTVSQPAQPAQFQSPPTAASLPPLQLNMEALTNMTLDQRRQHIGEAIYKSLSGIFQDRTGKITGMLLTIDEAELMKTIRDPTLLLSRAEMANKAYEEHLKKAGNQQSPGQVVKWRVRHLSIWKFRLLIGLFY